MSIGARLARARKAAGLSLRSMAQATNVSHAMIKKYEDGLATPSSDTLLKCAKTLGVRTEWFFRPDSVELEGVEFRKRASLPQKRINALKHQILEYVERRVELDKLLPNSPTDSFRRVERIPDVVHSLDEVEIVAEMVRSAWNLGCDPILDLIGQLEERGVWVFVLSTGEQRFDGLSATADDYPVMVIGADWPGDRQRFTLAHELGHLMLEGRLDNAVPVEAACNRFAGAFLFPKKEAYRLLGSSRHHLEARELATLKGQFGLSMQAHRLPRKGPWHYRRLDVYRVHEGLSASWVEPLRARGTLPFRDIASVRIDGLSGAGRRRDRRVKGCRASEPLSFTIQSAACYGSRNCYSSSVMPIS